MMRILLSLYFIIVLSATANAGPLSNFIFLGTDSEQYPVQDFQTDGAKSQTLTHSQTIDMSTWVHWEIYCAQAAQFRTLPTVTNNATYIQKPIPATTWFGRGVRHQTVKAPATKWEFTNFSTASGDTCYLEGM